ncbi:MAG: hypothetical protein ABH813_00790 [Patescibacteria group bacterium]
MIGDGKKIAEPPLLQVSILEKIFLIRLIIFTPFGLLFRGQAIFFLLKEQCLGDSEESEHPRHHPRTDFIAAR